MAVCFLPELLAPAYLTRRTRKSMNDYRAVGSVTSLSGLSHPGSKEKACDAYSVNNPDELFTDFDLTKK